MNVRLRRLCYIGVSMGEGPPLIRYEGAATFARVCPKCGRFVKADRSILMDASGNVYPSNNARCKKHSRVRMPFVGFV